MAETLTKKETTFLKSILEYKRDLLECCMKYCEFNTPRELSIGFTYYWEWYNTTNTDYDWYSSTSNTILGHDGMPTPSLPTQEGHSDTSTSNNQLLMDALMLAIKYYGKLSPKAVCQYAEAYLAILQDENCNKYLQQQRLTQSEWKSETSIKDDMKDLTNATVEATVRKIINTRSW